MIMFGMCTAFYIAIVVFELLPMYKEKDKKLFWTYAIILIITYTIHLLVVIGIKLPSPADPIKNFITAVFNLKS